jgi:phosphate-selective porin OprO/OprP
MSASWRNGLVLESAARDFRFHVGGRFNLDSVWWHEPRDLKGLPAPGGGAGLTPGLGVTNTLGVGPLDDGTFFRRVRLQMDGQAWELLEFSMEATFDNLTPVIFNDFWAGLKDVPVLGVVRFGQHKVPQGLESFGSTRYEETLARSALLDAIWQEFGTGIFLGNTALGQRMTWQADLAHRPLTDVNNSGAQFGDGDYAYTGRVTLLPVYEQDGRYLLHLGLSEQYRSAQKDRTTGLAGTPVDSPVAPGSTAANPIFLPTSGNVVRFRSRFDLRDSPATVGVAGLGNNNRAVDTGNILADGVWTTGLELLAYWGPFHLTAEAAWAHVDRALYPAVPLGGPGTIPGTPFNTNSVPRGDPTFWGAYAQVGWFLTGENRGYDRRLGRFDRVVPNENFFLVRGEDGHYHGALGAWEVVYRGDYLDLNSRGINGGLLLGHTFGLNWYLNQNWRFQVNYVFSHRMVKNSEEVTPAPTLSPISGSIHGLGVRVHFDF